MSGQYEHYFRGRTDRAWLRGWANQLARRGWSIGKGKRWLGRAGNDGIYGIYGIYGPEYKALAEAFQRDQRLRVDGLIAVATWDAAFKNPVA